MNSFTEWLDRHLVEGWRDVWRQWSVQATAVVGALQIAIADNPDLLITLAALLGGTMRLQALVVVVVLVIVALRLWRQEEEEAEDGEG